MLLLKKTFTIVLFSLILVNFVLATEKDFKKSRTYEELKHYTNVVEIKEKTIEIIIKICDSLNYNPAIILAMADVETGGKFNPILYSKGGYLKSSYQGIFQMSNVYTQRYNKDTTNVCSGMNRHCLYQAIPKLINKLEHRKMIYEYKGRVWRYVYYYSKVHNPTANPNGAIVKKFEKKLKYWTYNLEMWRFNIRAKNYIESHERFRKNLMYGVK